MIPELVVTPNYHFQLNLIHGIVEEFDNSEIDIRSLQRFLASSTELKKIYIFGSRASGGWSDDSDTDFMLIANDDLAVTKEKARIIFYKFKHFYYKNRKNKKTPIEINLISKNNFKTYHTQYGIVKKYIDVLEQIDGKVSEHMLRGNDESNPFYQHNDCILISTNEIRYENSITF